MPPRILPVFAILGLIARAQADSLSVRHTDTGGIGSLTWNRDRGDPVEFAFRKDDFAGPAFRVATGDTEDKPLPLQRAPGAGDRFEADRNGIRYSLTYVTREDRVEITAALKNTGSAPFTPARVALRLGPDTEMAKHPEWNRRLFPTLLRCEKTHFWGYFMRPDGRLLGVASPDPVASWANCYNNGGHRIRTADLDLLNAAPQPERHPHVNGTLAPGEERRWKLALVPLDDPERVQPALARIAGVPMLALDRPTVAEGEPVTGRLMSPASPVKSLVVTGPDGAPVSHTQTGDTFAFTPAQPGVYTLRLTTGDGKIAEAKASRRMPWSWYAKHARANAVSKPQKASSHAESWYGLFSGYIARRHFPDPALDAAIDARFREITPLMYDPGTMKPLATGPAAKFITRIQNHACWASAMVARYRATGDRRDLEFAASLADFLITCQTPDGAYRNGRTHYTSVIYIAKSMMEVMAAERPLAAQDPAWKERLDRHAASVRKAVDELERHLDNIDTEGELTYEDGMIACSYTQLAMAALLQTDPADRARYAEAAKKLAAGHRCLSQALIPDSRMNGGSLRYWESQYDILALTRGNNGSMMSSPHGWSAWRLYGLWYLYQLTGETDHLRQAMNGLGSCAQLIDFKDGDLRWGFVTDPLIHTRMLVRGADGRAVWKNRVIGEQYLPMISGWFRAPADTWVTGYWAMKDKNIPDGGCCDNDVHEIFKCLGEIALTSAYVVEKPDGSLETWNCTAARDASGTLVVTPAEAVVSRIHFNLKNPAGVRARFAAGEFAENLPAGLRWFGPGGVPEELRTTP